MPDQLREAGYRRGRNGDEVDRLRSSVPLVSGLDGEHPGGSVFLCLAEALVMISDAQRNQLGAHYNELADSIADAEADHLGLSRDRCFRRC